MCLSTQVRVLPGAALVRNRYAGGSLQTYAVLEQIQQSLPVVATGSAGGRSDLVIVRVTDPEFGSGDAGSSFEIVQGVPGTAGAEYATTLGYPAVALARIDLPASTATITDDMITDLRKVAIPRRETVQFMYDAPDDRRFRTGTTEYDGWPLQGSDSLGLWDTVEIPEWATYYQCVVTYTGVKSAGDTYGNVRLQVGSGTTLQIVGAFNTTNQSSSEVISSIQAANKGTVPASMRGTTQEMRLQGRLLSASIPSSSGPWATQYTRVVVQFDFAERAGMTGWRYLVFSEPAREYLGEVDLADVQLTRTLSGPGELSAVVTPGQDISLSPWHVSVWAEDASGRIRGGGLLLPGDVSSDGPHVECMGFSGYPQGMPWTAGQVKYVDTDPLNIVRAIWAHLQAQPGGGLGVAVDATTSPVRVGEPERQVEFTTGGGQDVAFEAGPYSLDWWSSHDLGKNIDDLAVETPFDYLEHTVWAGESLAHRLELGYPTIGSRRTNLRFEVGVNVTILPTLVGDEESYASEVHAFGCG